jgi:hypothetical protein
MEIGWSALTMTPSAEAVVELRKAWSWLLPERYEPVLFSALGDVFYEVPSNEIWWLNTGTAQLAKVAESKRAFQQRLGSEAANEWFLPGLVEALSQAGKVLGEGRCYTFVTLPVFREGTYTVENLNPVDAREHFALTGHIHEEIAGLQDGDKAEIKFVE